MNGEIWVKAGNGSCVEEANGGNSSHKNGGKDKSIFLLIKLVFYMPKSFPLPEHNRKKR